VKLDLEQLKQIVELVRQHDLAELEVESEGLRVKVRADARSGQMPQPASPSAFAPAAVEAAMALGTSRPAAASVEVPDSADEIELAVVKSPIVGTFFRSAEPDAAPFVEVGSVVKKGQVLCIIEAMKLMNEIDSEYDGEVTNIYVENGQPVQYGERLFAIKTGR
jgi:acetyl-CoA carboxylase biotin carboxyl carrier protein